MGNNRVFVVFGSKSDEAVYSRVMEEAEGQGLAPELFIASAHRTPLLVDEMVRRAEEEKVGVIIAGAGLAAHLPGVIASKTTIPVIGIPVNAALEGADAFLSEVQMPPGVPVLTVPVDCAGCAASLAKKISDVYNAMPAKDVGIISSYSKGMPEDVERRIKRGADFGFNLVQGEAYFKIRIVGRAEDVNLPVGDGLLINVIPESVNLGEFLSFVSASAKSPGASGWVGIKRFENAYIFFLQVMSRYSEDARRVIDKLRGSWNK